MFRSLRDSWNLARDHRLRRWLVLFLFLAAVCNVFGGTNASSRYALLCAMAEDRAFSIDPYVSMTEDWALKDGHYYSNKAPAAALLAFPFFKAVDSLLFRAPTREARDALRVKHSATLLHAISFIHIAIPFALVALLALGHLLGGGAYSRASILWTTFALLFGNLAALLSTAFFSHGMTGFLVLAMALAAIKRRPGWLGFCFGMALLSDYLAAALVPAAAFLVLRERSARFALRFLAGGVVPGALWCWYHQAAFGGILSIAHQNLNPEHVTPGTLIWGVLSVPDPHVLYRLVFGFKRGILWTQPWILLAVAGVVAGAARLRGNPAAWIAGSGLLILLLINGSFNGWHAGSSPGPRYLSIVFPAFALLLPAILDQGPRKLAIALKIAIVYSVVFHLSAMSTYYLPSAWMGMWKLLAVKLVESTWTTIGRLALAFVPMAALVALEIRKARRLSWGTRS